LVISREIRPLAALYTPILKKGWYAHAYGTCTPFYNISLKKLWEGYNAARGLISRDIAKAFMKFITFLRPKSPNSKEYFMVSKSDLIIFLLPLQDILLKQMRKHARPLNLIISIQFYEYRK
jgi:hypothetical protein